MGGKISDEDIQKVRDASDLTALFSEIVPVKQRGRDFWCCCPFHNEKTPSLKIDPERQLWHCFGCGAGGDLFAFVEKSEGLSFPEAVRRLAERAHIELSCEEGADNLRPSQRNRLKEACQAAADFYHTQLMRGASSEAAAARSYLHGRNLGGNVPKEWGLGFAPGRETLVRHLSHLGFTAEEMALANLAVKSDNGRLRDRFFNRVMFPIYDDRGDCIAFGGRVIGTGEPKYLNSQETPVFHKSRVLYGLDKAKAALASTGTAIVTEGYTDVIALHQAGIRNAVATLGTALGRAHIRLLSRHARHRIVYLFDGDAAGQRAADRALSFIDESMTPEAGRLRVELVAVTLPDNLDPADFVAARGADALRELIEQAVPLVQYGINRRLAAHDLSRPEGRSAALTDALSVLAPIKESMLARSYASQIASLTRFREEDVLAKLATLKVLAAPKEEAQTAPRDSQSGSVPRQALGGGGITRYGLPASGNRVRTQAEVSRLRFERQLLSLAAQYPAVGLAQAGALASTAWTDALHGAIAQALLSCLSQKPGISSAQLVSSVSRSVPQAAGLLTEDAASGQDPSQRAAFLAEELAIGDAEEALAAFKAQLAAPGALSAEERDEAFAAVVAMQQDLLRRKQAHRP